MKKLFFIFTVLLTYTLLAQTSYFVRYSYNENIRYGILDENMIQPLKGNVFEKIEPHGKPIPLENVDLLLPTKPQNVFAVGMNFASHIASDEEGEPPMFFKSPSSLITSGKTITLPKDATNVHFEGELVIVVGKEAKNIEEDEAHEYIFGVTVGNDLTERYWQSYDLQWMRAKASDGFGPVGFKIAQGVDYNNLLLTTKLNGKIVQEENTKFMIHKPKKVLSYLSRYFTLQPGDLIFMGTPGQTLALNDGDIVSVTLEDVGEVINSIHKEE